MINLAPFLSESDVVDYRHPLVVELASTLAAATPEQTAKRCFDWVRDRIEHCIDFKRDEVPVTASDTLQIGTGFCIAKSHLLVALLRGNGIPAGFCYQRLTLDGPNPPYCLHGFVAVWLEVDGWYRCDARGNSKLGIDCQFTPGKENLAYPVQYPGECIYSEVWAEPWPELVEAMKGLESVAQYCVAPIDLEPPAKGRVVGGIRCRCL